MTSQGANTSRQRMGKILSKVGKFLMFGGWILVMFLVLGIIIALSTC